MAIICFIWRNFCLWQKQKISGISKSSFESLVRQSDMGILWSGCVFVIPQCGWLVMKAEKPIIVSSYVCWKNEHQAILSLPAFLASQEAVLALWYMWLVQLIIISFFFGMIQLFSTSAVYLYILFRCLIKCHGQKYLRNNFFILNCLRFVPTDRNSRKRAVNWEQVGHLYRPDIARHCHSHVEGRPSKCKGIPQVFKVILSAWFYWELCLPKLVGLTVTIIF